jgi:hypothetical protein
VSVPVDNGATIDVFLVGDDAQKSACVDHSTTILSAFDRCSAKRVDIYCQDEDIVDLGISLKLDFWVAGFVELQTIVYEAEIVWLINHILKF